MSRRKCDQYDACEECDWHTKYTEKIKECADEYGYHEVLKVLEFARVGGLLTCMPGYEHKWGYGAKADGIRYRIPRCTKEQNCLTHYCNPNGIYSDNEYDITVKFFKNGEPYLAGFEALEKDKDCAIEYVTSYIENSNFCKTLIKKDEIDSDRYEISEIVEDGVVIFKDGVWF